MVSEMGLLFNRWLLFNNHQIYLFLTSLKSKKNGRAGFCMGERAEHVDFDAHFKILKNVIFERVKLFITALHKQPTIVNSGI